MMTTGSDWGTITKADRRDRKHRRGMRVSGRSFSHAQNAVEHRARRIIERARKGSEVTKDWTVT